MEKLQHAYFVKRTTGLSTKKGVSCVNILALGFLFLLASFSSNMTILDMLTYTLKVESLQNPGGTAEEIATSSYKNWLVIEMISLVMSIFFGLLAGYLYEIWSRKTVLIICMVVQALGIVLVTAVKPDEDASYKEQNWYALSRMVTAAVAEIIMANPLLNNYVKRSDHGWAHAI